MAIVPREKSVLPARKGVVFLFTRSEKFIAELRQRQLTPVGRAKLRERVAVEHSFSHIGRWQGDKARYLGVRKNLFDLRRTAVVHNLHILGRLLKEDPELFASKAGAA